MTRRILFAALLLAGSPARADGPSPCARFFPADTRIEVVNGAPRLELEVDESSRRLGPGSASDQGPVALVRPARAMTFGGVKLMAGAPLYLRCPASGEPELVSGRVADDTLLGGVLYPADTTLSFRGGKVTEAGLTEPMFIGGWRFPAWTVVRFSADGTLASAQTSEGGDALLARADRRACSGEPELRWDEAPVDLDCGRSCFFRAGERSLRLHTTRDCAADEARLRPLELGRTRLCGIDLPAGDAIELREADRGWLLYFRPGADVVVQGVPFLRGHRMALECPLGAGREGPGRLRLGTLAAPARFRDTLFPSLTQLIDRPGTGGTLRVRLPMPLTVRGVRYPTETVLSLDPAGRVRRAVLAVEQIFDGVVIGDRVCRLSPNDPIELSESGAVTRCTKVR